MVIDKERERLSYVPRKGDHVRFIYKEPDPDGVIEKAVIVDEDWWDAEGDPLTVGYHESVSGDRVEVLSYAECDHYCARCGPLPGGKPAGPRR